jgi:hypothetical protein
VVRALLQEVIGRDDATGAHGARARISRPVNIFELGRSGDSSIPVATQNALMALEWIHRSENFAVSGASGAGKTHLWRRWRASRSRLT